MAGNNSLQSKDIFVRVQFFPHDVLVDKTVKHLKAFRLRLKDNSTFAELASIALARYEKDDPERGSKARIDSVLDEKDFEVDMDDSIDLIVEGEVLKLVLAADWHATRLDPPLIFMSPPVDQGKRSSQTPAVKNIRPRTPAALQPLALKSYQSSQMSHRTTPHPESSPQILAPTITRQLKSSNRSIQGMATGGKQDPYEVPSDSENLTSHIDQNRAPGRQIQKTVSQRVPQPVEPAPTKTIPPGTKIISIKDSSPSSDASDAPRAAENVQIRATPHQQVVKSSQITLRSSSATHGINSNLSIVGNGKDVPIYLGGKTSSATRPGVERAHISSASSNTSAKSAMGVGTLTLTPSRVAQATKDWLQHESEQREAGRKQVARQHANLETSRKIAKGKAKGNLPSAAIAYIKQITRTKSHRKEPKQRIPSSFYKEPDHSDEDLGDIITGIQVRASDESEEYQAHPITTSSQGSKLKSKRISPTTNFKPINTLWPRPNAEPEARPPKKFGAGYSQRVRDAFSDSDSDSDDTNDSYSEPVEIYNTGTPEPFSRWRANYETNFTPHMGFCSVAGGPFKGLIRSGPNKGSYLFGYAPPTQETIAEMEKTAILKDITTDFDSAELDTKESDSDFEKLPSIFPQSIKSTVSTTSAESVTTSVLIMRQLSQDVPPSNQELATLMSSSPSRGIICQADTPTRRRPIRLAATKGVDKLEPGSSIGALANSRVMGQSQSIVEETPKRQNKTHPRDADLDVTPSFERALSQVETPSTRSRSSQEAAVKIKDVVKDTVRRAATGRIVVKIPEISAEKQAEYKKIPKSLEQGSLSVPLRSFREINREHEDGNLNPQDSGAAAIEHVLKASPSWLANITDAGARFSKTSRHAPYALRSTGGTPAKAPLASHKKRDVDEIEDQESTYQPSELEGQSDGSGHVQKCSPRKTTKKGADVTPPRGSQKIEPASQVLIRVLPPKHLLTPATKGDLHINDSGSGSSIPIRVHTLSDLLQKTEHTPNIAVPRPQADFEKGLKSSPKLELHSTPPKREFEMMLTAPIAASIVPAIDVAKRATESDHKTRHKCGKRKRLDEDEDEDDAKGNNSTVRREQKKHKKLKSGSIATEYENRKDQEAKHSSKERKGHHQLIHCEALDAAALDPVLKDQSRSFEPVVGTQESHNVNRGSSSDPPKRKRRMQNRKLHRQLKSKNPLTLINLPVHTEPTASTPGTNLAINPMPKRTDKPYKAQSREAKASGYGFNPTLPPRVIRESASQPSPTTQKVHHSKPSVERKKEAKYKRNVSKCTDEKFLSPPTTSRPSSAGSMK